MPAKSQNIYGLDDTSFAESIASQALSTPDSDRYSGSPVDEDARSKSSPKTDEVAGESVVKKHDCAGKDSRAHSAGNDGEKG